MMRALIVLTVLAFAGAAPAMAETVSVAVAANFTATAEQLAAAFTAQTGDEVVLSFGATGGLYAQISQGAPFEILLAADAARPAKAIAEGLAAAGSNFTYAVGRLALYSTTIQVSGAAALDGSFDRLAIADPAAAPYGAAAVEVLKALGKYDAVAARLVIGENISQTLQFVETGNAELGFVAASQVVGKDFAWIVPEGLHQPIRQDAVLLKTGQSHKAAVAFLQFLRSDVAIAIIEAAGYSVPH